jgi:hypothetical protein
MSGCNYPEGYAGGPTTGEPCSPESPGGPSGDGGGDGSTSQEAGEAGLPDGSGLDADAAGEDAADAVGPFTPELDADLDASRD